MHGELHAYDGVMDVPFLLGFCNGIFSLCVNLWFLTVAGTFRSWRKGGMTFLLILIYLVASGIAVRFDLAFEHWLRLDVCSTQMSPKLIVAAASDVNRYHERKNH